MSVKYVIEPVETQRPPKWGDLDPATKELTGRYNGKFPGACQPGDSVVTEENGYENVVILPPGQSPAEYIKEQERIKDLVDRPTNITSTEE